MFYVIKIEFEKAISEMLIWDFLHQCALEQYIKNSVNHSLLNKNR